MPATLVWTGGGSTTSYYDDLNWTVEVGGVLTSTRREPQPGDDLIFRATNGGSNKWCTGMGYTYYPGGTLGGAAAMAPEGEASALVSEGEAAPMGPGGGTAGEVGPVRSIRLIQGYTGHLVLDLQQQVETLELASPGAIDQPYGLIGNTALTVTKQFTWTLGTLNSTTNPSSLTVTGTGTTALIDPPDSGSLITRDNIYLQNGVQGTFLPGTVQMLGNVGMEVTDQNTAVAVQPQQAAKFRIEGDANSYDMAGAKVKVKSGASLSVTGPGIFECWYKQLQNDGGILEVQGGATVRFGSGALLGPPVGQPLKSDILMTGGSITVHSGSSLGSTWGQMEMTGGLLYARANEEGGTATIACPLVNSGADIRITRNYGALLVKGDVRWTGGIYIPSLDVGAVPKGDQWKIEGKLTVGGTATIQPLTTGYDPAVGLPNGFFRAIIRADKGIVSTVAGQPPTALLVNQGANKPTYKLRITTPVAGQPRQDWELIPG